MFLTSLTHQCGGILTGKNENNVITRPHQHLTLTTPGTFQDASFTKWITTALMFNVITDTGLTEGSSLAETTGETTILVVVGRVVTLEANNFPSC